MVRIEITGLQRVQKYFIELAPKEERFLSRTNFNFMKKIRRSAKARAPRDTGYLANTIRVAKTIVKGSVHQFKLVVDAEYAIFQEEGFTPHFAMILNSSKISPGVYFVKKFTPFVKPALEHNLNVLSQDLNRGMEEALAK